MEICGVSKMEIFRIRKAYKENGILGLVDTKGLYRKNKTKLSTWMQEYALREYRTFGAGGFNFTELWCKFIRRQLLKNMTL